MTQGLSSAARQIQSYGRGPDTMLAHVSPSEMAFIDYMQGGQKTNPHTGLPEYGFLGNLLKSVARVAGGIVGYTIGGPAGAAIGTGLTTKLTGGSWDDALQAGAVSGIGSFGVKGLTGGGWDAFSPGDSQAVAAQGIAKSVPDTGVPAGSTQGLSAAGLSAESPGMLAQYGSLAASGLGGALAPVSPAASSSSAPAPTPDTFRLPPVVPLQRTFRPYTGDPLKYGQPGQGGEHSFFAKSTPPGPSPTALVPAGTGPAVPGDLIPGVQYLADGGAVGSLAGPTVAALRQGFMTAARGGPVRMAAGGPMEEVTVTANGGGGQPSFNFEGGRGSFFSDPSNQAGPFPQDIANIQSQLNAAMQPPTDLMGKLRAKWDSLKKTISDPNELLHSVVKGVTGYDYRTGKMDVLGGIGAVARLAFPPLAMAGTIGWLANEMGVKTPDFDLKGLIDGQSGQQQQQQGPDQSQGPPTEFIPARVEPVSLPGGSTVGIGGSPQPQPDFSGAQMPQQPVGLGSLPPLQGSTPQVPVQVAGGLAAPPTPGAAVPAAGGAPAVPVAASGFKPYQGDYMHYGEANGEHMFLKAGGRAKARAFRNDPPPSPMAQVGAVNGPGHGKEDLVNTMLSAGEHVIPASDVSYLGNGSNEAGHRVLEQFKQEIRRRAGQKNVKQPSKSVGTLGSLMKASRI